MSNLCHLDEIDKFFERQATKDPSRETDSLASPRPFK